MNRSRRPPLISVVICNNGRASTVAQCLQALVRQEEQSFELLVVQNGNDDPEIRKLTQNGLDFRYEWIGEEGLSRARNHGLNMSTAPLIAFIDADAVPQPAWLGNLVKAFDDPLVMAAGGRIAIPECDPETRELCIAIQGAGSLEPKVVDISDPEWFRKAAFGHIGTGGNMAFRRTVLKGWPGFDERLGLPHSSCEDLYAFLSIVAKGHRLAYAPDAVVVHPVPLPDVSALRERALSSQTSAMRYWRFLFFEAHGYKLRCLQFLWKALVKRVASLAKATSGRAPAIRSRDLWRARLQGLIG